MFENSELRWLPLITAPVHDCGSLADDLADVELEIVQRLFQGWRPPDELTGIEGGSAEGVFNREWDGNQLSGFSSLRYKRRQHKTMANQ